MGSGVTDGSLFNVKGQAGFADDGTNAGIIIGTDDANGAAIHCLTTGGFTNGSYGTMRLNAAQHKFTYGNTERLLIDSSGNLTAVNTTSGATTGVTLKVGASAASGTNSGTIIINNGGLGNASLQFDYENSAARAKIYTYRSTNDIIFDTSGAEKIPYPRLRTIKRSRDIQW